MSKNVEAYYLLTLSKFLPEGFSEGDGLIVDVSEVNLADSGAGHRGPVMFISATGLDPLIAQLGIVQGEREERYL